MADSLILMVLALVVFGPRRLPQIGRQIGKLMYEFRKASNDFKFQMEEELRLSEDAERRKKEEAQRAKLSQESVSAPPKPAESLVPELKAPESEDSVPRIMPPSTGDPVSATRAVSQADGTSAEGTGTIEVPDSIEVLDPIGQLEQPAPESADPATKSANASATEAVSHNG
jgi:sec-independent protein translocase protein TatB